MTDRHSPAAHAWAKRYGIDLNEFVPFKINPGHFTETVAEAARDLGIGEEQVRRLLRSGVIRGIPLGGRFGWRVSRHSVAEYAQERLERQTA